MAIRLGLAWLAALICLVSTVSSASVMTRHLLDGYDGAVCLDGTPGGYYFSAGSGDHVNDWVIFFQGGGWCFSDSDCYARSKTRLGSSNPWPSTIPCEGGPLDCDCKSNDAFCQYNKVYLWYCDGDSFAGNRYDTVDYNGTKLFFRGHRILEATLLSLEKMPNPLSKARNVLLSGCSAGGLATYLHADWVHEHLPASVERYGAMPISGFFLQHDNVENRPVYPDEIAAIFELANATAGVDQDCIAAYPVSEQWKCNFAQFTYDFVSSPIFAVNSKYDSWQAGCILTAEPVPVGSLINENCSAAPGWSQCTHSLEHCTAEQAATLSAYGVDFLAIMNASSTASKPGNGGAIDACLSHCEGFSNWDKVKIGEYTIQEAVGKWWQGAVDTPAADNWHWDCDLSESAPFNCNPTCV